MKLALLLITMAGLLSAQEVKVHRTSKAGDRLAAKGSLRLRPAGAADKTDFRIDAAATRQRIDGFGASFLEAGIICLNSLDPAAQDEVLRELFDPAQGAGFSVMKTVIAGTDFMSAGGWYTYNDTPGDVAMKNFSIARDLGPNGLVTFIKRARAFGSFKLQAPMDFPPDWMLIDLQKKQDVDPRYFDALALYYLRYVQEYAKQGVSIDYLSLFNEPGVYTRIPYTKIRDLIKNHVGPLFEKSGVRTRLQLSEAPVREQAWKNYPIVLDDPGARKYIAGAPYHGYDFKDFAKIAELTKRYPDIPFWMTEICWAYEAGASKQIALPRHDYEDGDFWANQIFSDLEAGASAWLYWNMILDEKGGPWLTSLIHHNPDPNVQHPVVVIDRATHKVHYLSLYYYLAHFSKWVRPGAVRLETAGHVEKVRAMAFGTAQGGVVLQVLNSRMAPAKVSVAWRGKTLEAELPALSISTYQW